MKQSVWLLLLTVFALSIGYIAFGANYFSTISGIQESKDSGDVEKSPKLQQTGVVKDLKLRENSGIDFSIRYEDALWMHNDSGEPPVLFLVGTDGKTLAECSVFRAANLDWEDICSFQWQGKSYVAVGDVGDNLKKRTSCQLYLIEEPKVELNHQRSVAHTILKHQKIDFKYEDGPKNCEAIAFDPRTRSFWLVEKIYQEVSHQEIPGVYQLKLNDDLTAESGVAKRISDYPVRNVTGMDLHDDRLVVRNYAFAHLVHIDGDWEKAFSEKRFDNVALPIQRQGEAICFSPEGDAVFVASELTRQPLYRIKLSDQKSKSETSHNPSPESISNAK